MCINPFRLIGVGLSVWTLATIGCGFSVDFWSITICRMLVGVGEASYIGLAAPLIVENAPVSQRTLWLGIFHISVPAGVAIGDVYGGLVGSGLGWRYAFFGEAILMLPFAILGYVMKPLQMKGMSNAKIIPWFLNEEFSKKDYSYVSYTLNQLSRFGQDMKALLSEKVYVVNVLGYIVYNFVFGVYSYWGLKVGYNIYQVDNIDLLFGGIISVGGIVGTIGGSLILDRINSTIPNAFKLLSIAIFFGAIFCFSAFCFSNIYVFLVLILIGEILVDASQGPVNLVCLNSVKPSLRPLAMAISTVSIHIFGDDKVDNWRTSILISTSILFLAAGIWFIGIFLHSVDRYEEDSEQPDMSHLLESEVANGDITSALL
ncbi:unnamed protein product [Lactuca saligna]|uniref:Major facilitator superfamily (MFS) profile domain-containing protein n=1 Tax=Lactuca saligna TaxID=75948 RepID=A0AA36A476_LACSI|nr:unnamed protein product [Lactuca saligna]